MHPLIAFVLTACLAMPACAESKPQPRTPGSERAGYVWNKDDPEVAAALRITGDPVKGEYAYQVCRGCHRADGSGRADANYPQLAGQHVTVLIKQMVDVRAGRRDNPKMHPFIARDVISGEDMAHIAAYLNSLPLPAGNGKGDGRNLDRGRTLYDRDCARCHGRNGEGDGTKFYPLVASQHYAYLFRESKAIQRRFGGRRNADPDMVKVIRSYTDTDIAAVSDYMSRLRPPAK